MGVLDTPTGEIEPVDLAALPRFNLATFVTTWMDDEADRLYAETADKSMVDKDGYPQTADIEAPVPAAGARRVPADPADVPGRRRSPERRDRGHAGVRARLEEAP